MSRTSLDTFLHYDFNQSAKITGNALAVVNSELTTINLKTASLWTKIVLFFTSGLDKAKIGKFVLTHKDEWQREIANDHSRQVAFEKQCWKAALTFLKYSYYSSPNERKRLRDSLNGLSQVGLRTLHVAIQHPYTNTSSGAGIETHRELTFNRFTKAEDINQRILHIIRGVKEQENGRCKASQEVFDVTLSGDVTNEAKDSLYLKDADKGQDRFVTIRFQVRK